MVTPLLLQLALAAPWDAPDWAPLPWSRPPAPVGWEATEATFTLHIRDGEPVEVEARYRFATPEPAMANLRLVSPDLLVTDVSGPVLATGAGLVVALSPGPLAHEQALRGLYAVRADGRMLLDVHPAARTRVVVDAPGLDVTVAGAVDGALSPTSRLEVSWSPQRDTPPPARRPLVHGEVATAFRAEGGGLAVDSAVRWQVLQGEVDSFRFEAPGLDELEVVGPGVASWSASGGTVTVKAKSKVKGLFAVRVRGRAKAAGEVRVPAPVPVDVARVERLWTMGKADEGELIPVATPASLAEKELPEWARGLGDGAPLAHWRGRADLRVLPVAWDAVQGPDTVITSARYVVSAAREGRIALRQVYRVRNERRQYLHVRAAPGWRPIVVRVGGLPVSALDDGQGGLFIPLEKSVETLRGLLAFPVDVEWIGEDEAWSRRGLHAFQLPSVDAPVTTASWEVHLPRGYRALGRDGRSYLATVDTSEDRRKREVVDSAVLKAASAYKENDFETAQRWLDEAKNYEADNDDVAQLQDNLDVLSGKAAPEVSSSNAQARRVKELAKAKTSGLVDRQQVIEKDAEMNYRSGDYDRAEALWSEALRLANELERTEQAESTVQKSNIAEAEARLSSIREQKAKAKPAEPPPDDASRAPGKVPSSSVAASVSTGAALEALGYLDDGDDRVGDLVYGGDAGGEAGAVLGGEVGGVQGGTLGGMVSHGNLGLGGLGTVGSGRGGGGSAEGRGEGYGRGSPAPSPEAVAEEEPMANLMLTPGSREVLLERMRRDEVYAQEAAAADEIDEIDEVEAVPAGRSYQSVMVAVPGAGAKGKRANKEEAKADKTAGIVSIADTKPASTASSTRQAAGGPPAPRPSAPPVDRPAEPPRVTAMPQAAAPPPPPPAPVQAPSAAVAKKSLLLQVLGTTGEAAPAEDIPPQRRAITFEAEEITVELRAPTADGNGFPAARDGQAAPGWTESSTTLALLTPTTPPPRPPPERRKALEASPSPMALAMSLDSPAVTHEAALLPAGAYPTFTVRYKELPGENL